MVSIQLLNMIFIGALHNFVVVLLNSHNPEDLAAAEIRNTWRLFTSETALMGDNGLDPLKTVHAFCNNVSVTIDGITMHSANLDPETNAFTQPYLLTMDAVGNKTIEEKLGSLRSSVRWHEDDADTEKSIKTEEVGAKYRNGLTDSDKCIIQALREEKGYSLNKILQEYPSRQWKKSTVIDFLKKLRGTGSGKRRPGSGRPKTVRTDENVQAVEDLILSQEGRPGTSMSVRQVAKETGIDRSSVRRIVKKYLNLKAFKRVTVQELSVPGKKKRLDRCKRLLERFPTPESVKKIWFSDEKRFTVVTPRNTQNDRVHAAVKKKSEIVPERLLGERSYFSESVMVSLAVSSRGKTKIFFIPRGVKINSQNYREELLSEMLPEIEDVMHDYTFMQDGAPAHTALATIQWLRENCPDFIEPENWPPNSPDLNIVDYFVRSALEEKVYRGQKIRCVDELKERILVAWEELSHGSIATAILKWKGRLKAVIRQKDEDGMERVSCMSGFGGVVVGHLTGNQEAGDQFPAIPCPYLDFSYLPSPVTQSPAVTYRLRELHATQFQPDTFPLFAGGVHQVLIC
ncbi:unnamed protein product, partial [Darwinula stevensoni]